MKQRREDRARTVQRQHDVVLDRVAFEDSRLLELAADAHHGDLGLVMLGQIDVCR